ncbi:MAG: ATP-binding cassette domain-containing protein, partial [Candidatus Marinimicrobia bacterium]|nr:ATP-binding cassette domain-containing protein [Candidatus Neomarinimicrobiota bacterium]
KSSLLKLIMGLIEPNSGAIIVGERQVRFGYVDGVKDGQIAYLAQQMDELFFGETVAQELSYQKEQLTSEDHQLLEQLNMEHLLPRRIDTLSGGEKQGIALVQFLANSAPLLLLDEPSSYLDKQAAQVLRKALVRAHEQGRTIVHATQFKREVAWGSHVLDLDSQQPRVERL